MGSVLDLADNFWNGDMSTFKIHPFTELRGLEEISTNVAFVSSFANVVSIATDDGLVLIDTGSFLLSGQIFAEIRGWSKKPVKSAVFTHGHIDHVFGLGPFEAEHKDNGWSAPEVYAHEAIVERFDRYKLTLGYNTSINRRQFQMSDLNWPAEYRYPDQTYRTQLDVDVGGVKFHLHHDKGETDDHTWVWIPEHSVLCTGDLFIWASPNCGNPQKVQRFPREWAAALRKMADKKAKNLFPGHGPPIVGEDRVERALSETAELLETIVDQTLALMNDGARLDDVLAGVKAPERLLERPYLRPVYDEPEFIVRNIWRLYGGWYDGNPAHLKPARDRDVATQLAELAGGSSKLADRALELSEKGEHRVACHLIEFAGQAQPDDEGILEIRRKVYSARAEAETSLMAKGVYTAASQNR